MCPQAPKATAIYGNARTCLASMDATYCFTPQGMPAQRYERLNRFHTGYRVGQVDNQWQFTGGPFIELDSGHDFYAAQTLVAADGRRLLWAWIDMWESPTPTEAHHWRGMLGLPRELEVRANRLCVKPARELIALRQTPLPGTPWWSEAGSQWLTDIHGDMLEIHVHWTCSTAPKVTWAWHCVAVRMARSRLCFTTTRR